MVISRKHVKNLLGHFAPYNAMPHSHRENSLKNILWFQKKQQHMLVVKVIAFLISLNSYGCPLSIHNKIISNVSLIKE